MKTINRDIKTPFTETIHNEVFICAQGETHSEGIIIGAEELNPQIIEKLIHDADAKILKIICSQSHYDKFSSALNMFSIDLKFVPREGSFEIYFDPFNRILRLKKNENLGKQKVKVLVVDDSTTICNLLTKIMSLSPEIEVVGTINDPRETAKAIQELTPDVITLDIHMPHINGVELLKQIYPQYKIPCIMISSISISEGPLVLDALDAGAIDYIQKPDMKNFVNIASEINKKLISASKAVHQDKNVTTKVQQNFNIDISDHLILLGASTGGTRALKDVLDHFPKDIPPTLIVQHIPAEFSKAFADRLNQSTPFLVKEAQDGDEILPNKVLVAPGDKQMKFVMQGAKMFVEINDDEPVNRFKPSVDYLFNSVANSTTQKKIVAAIFTGMGRDGAKGMELLKKRKAAHTIAQDEKSCVVFGMPKEAIKLGCVDVITPLSDAADEIMSACRMEALKNAQ